ncbi:MAG: Calx-beta domain-containing protein [Chloroflexota bacterium]
MPARALFAERSLRQLLASYEDTTAENSQISATEMVKGLTGTVWLEMGMVKASDGAAGDYYGQSVAIDGTTAVVGAMNEDDKGIDAGAAYILTRIGHNWVEDTKFLASDGAAGDSFGYSVGVNGDTVVIGARADDDRGVNAGAVYVYMHGSGGWTETKLHASDGAADDLFGTDVAIDGDYLVIGAPNDDDYGSYSGSAYVFKWDGNTWVQQAKLTVNDVGSNGHLGINVDIEGNRILVAAFGHDNLTGAVYTFLRNGDSWVQEAKLQASDGEAGDHFGHSVAISGDTAVIGAYRDDAPANDSGSAYIFTFNVNTWQQQAKLVAHDGANDVLFGHNVDIQDTTVVVGAPRDNELGTRTGATYVYTFNGQQWVEQKLLASNGDTSDEFGNSTAISGNSIIVGSRFKDFLGVAAGAVYLFENRESPTITYDPLTGLLPNEMCPVWAHIEAGNPEEPNIVDGKLMITTTQNADNLGYVQTDLTLTSPLVIEVRVKRISGSSSSPDQAPISIGFTSEPNIGNTLYIGEDEIFIVDASLNVDDSAPVDTDGSFHDYRIEVDAVGSIQVFYDKILMLSGSVFTSTVANGPVERIIWGELSPEAYGISEWEWIRHNATRTQLCDTDVFVEKSVSHATALPGQPVTYTLNYGNNGSDIAFNTMITDALPGTIQNPYILSSGSIITQTGTDPLTWQVQDLAPGESGMITVTGVISPDLQTEMTLTNTVEISNSMDISLANNVATAVSQIVIPEISFSQSSYTVDESAGSITITAVLSPAQPFMDVFVDYQTVEGTAVSGEDYTTVSGILTFLQGITQTTIAIPILDDDIPELDKTFSLALSTPAHAILNNSTAAVTILDDDILPTESLVFLPIVLNIPAPLEPDFPIFIGESIASRPVTSIGEIFYTTTLNIPAALPETGQFFLSSQPEQLSQIVVDDELVMLLDGAEVFVYTFSSADSSPKSAIVEIPRSVVELLAGQTGITVVYRDVFGYGVSASAIWFQYVP